MALPLASVMSSRRHASVPRMISAGGYHLNGSAATSAWYPASVSARRRPSTCDSAPPVVKGTCVVQMSMLRIVIRIAERRIADCGLKTVWLSSIRNLQSAIGTPARVDVYDAGYNNLVARGEATPHDCGLMADGRRATPSPQSEIRRSKIERQRWPTGRTRYKLRRRAA